VNTVRSVAGELVKRLAEEEFTVYLSFDEDEDASILTSWRNSGDAHGRYGVVDEDGLHTYALIGFQGRPRVTYVADTASDVSIERFVEAMKQFRSDQTKIPDLG
jgi:hypothetical protein